MGAQVKICGITEETALRAALDGGADFIGLVFFAPSPRHVELEQAARLADMARGRAQIVALSVDADDELVEQIARIVRPGYMQLHGTESPQRAEQIARICGARIIKAFRIRKGGDILKAHAYAGIMDFPVFDAWVPPQKAQGLPGGTGHAFDWAVLEAWEGPYMLAGGLTPDNVRKALAITGAPMVDVSSGVEAARGRKDPRLIRQFLAAAKAQ